MLSKLFKSKTINFNVWVPVVAMVLKTAGVEVPAEVWAGIIAIGNFILRLVTKEPIADK